METKTLTKENFDEVLGESSLPMIVDFWADWCGPCKMFAPVLDEFASEHADKVSVGKVNIDESPELASRYGVMSIPTVILFEKGQAKKSLVGAQPKEALENLLV